MLKSISFQYKMYLTQQTFYKMTDPFLFHRVGTNFKNYLNKYLNFFHYELSIKKDKKIVFRQMERLPYYLYPARVHCSIHRRPQVRTKTDIKQG